MLKIIGNVAYSAVFENGNKNKWSFCANFKGPIIYVTLYFKHKHFEEHQSSVKS